MSSPESMPVVHVVDDEAPFRRSLLFLLESVGWQAVGHDSAEAFLQVAPELHAGGGCLVLDIRMPRISGLELQRRLRAAGSPFPIIFMTGHGEVELAVQAMKNGAVDFLQKPFKDQLFLDTIERAVQLSLERHAANRRHREAREVLDRLSVREYEVARLLALGLANKEAARQLNISDNTVHVHRQHVMEKTGTSSAAELARLILRADPNGLD
ncbi:response regulator transcription factor [Rhodocyclus purpureus]|uniref:response regulator transcription factor n=1 Tax=Rhodocyclus purpureus TaxID=1067 RepID=UPI001912CCC9|nr:response regulator [Rhodocyclus purpureus]MBK5914120.1 DNA-binding response regulator [Rhodocyclus purpureus]